MKLVNGTPFPFRATRDSSDELGSLTVTTRVGHRLSSESNALLPDQGDEIVEGAPWPTAELGTARTDVQVVVQGAIRSSGTPFVRRDLVLRMGDRVQRLTAFGPRKWALGDDGTLRPTPALPTAEVPMTWHLAYGGTHRNPPGLVEGTGLPGPSTELAWPSNPGGTGFFRFREEAAGQALPQIEDSEHLVEAWDDRPVACCWAPLPAQSSLHIEHWMAKDGRLGVDAEPEPPPEYDTQSMSALRMRFPLGAGSGIALDGFLDDGVSTTVPAAPFAWDAVAGARSLCVAPTLTHLILLPNAGAMILFYRTVVHVPLVRHEVREVTQVPVRGPVA